MKMKQEQLVAVVALQVGNSWGGGTVQVLTPAGIVSSHAFFFFLLLADATEDGKYLSYRLTTEEVVRLNSGLEHIMDIMGETVSEHVIKTTIVR